MVVTAGMAYYIAVYDIGEKRVTRMLKLFRRYLTWVQNSVFEGELRDSQIKRLETEAKALMNEDEDCVIFYRLESEKLVQRSTLGTESGEIGAFL